MKKIFLIIAVLLVMIQNVFAFDHNYDRYRTLLDETVDNGLVDYKRMQSDPKLLQTALLDFSEITEQEYALFDRSQKIAYMINAYNIYTIEGIVKKYPVKSIKGRILLHAVQHKKDAGITVSCAHLNKSVKLQWAQ